MGRKVTFFLALPDFFRADDTGAGGTRAVAGLVADVVVDDEPSADIINER